MFLDSWCSVGGFDFTGSISRVFIGRHKVTAAIKCKSKRTPTNISLRPQGLEQGPAPVPEPVPVPVPALVPVPVLGPEREARRALLLVLKERALQPTLGG